MVYEIGENFKKKYNLKGVQEIGRFFYNFFLDLKKCEFKAKYQSTN